MGVTEGDFLGIDVDIILGNCTIPFVMDQPPPSTLVVYSTMQYSTIEIII